MDIPKFDTKKELYKYLIENKSQLINLKKSATKYSDSSCTSVPKTGLDKEIEVKSQETGVLNKTVVGNTYNWMDSHDDVNVENTFIKIISERGGSVFHLHDHEFKLTSKIGEPRKIYEKSVPWKDFGVNKQGSTTALMMDTDVMKSYNNKIFNAYKNGDINQHSVGMQYVKIELAINDEEQVKEFEVWNKHIDQIGNKEKAEQKGYFWAVKEANLIEISAVLMGSNELTPTLENKTEPPQDTQESMEAEKSLQLENAIKEFEKQLKF